MLSSSGPYPGCVYAALMRGLNVGTKNRLAMADLAAVFEAEGCSDVRTYVQSGNVVFGAPEATVRGLESRIPARILADFGMDVPLVLRSGAELAAVAAANPFRARGEDPATLHVVFLAAAPEPGRAATLDPDRSPPDEFVAAGREVYLFLPSGMGRTKLTNAYLERCLGVVGTARNWRTTLALAEMAAR